jgi:hypothetical protein
MPSGQPDPAQRMDAGGDPLSLALRRAQLHTSCRMAKWLARSFHKHARQNLKQPHWGPRKEDKAYCDRFGTSIFLRGEVEAGAELFV